MFYRLKKKLLHFSTNGNIAEDFIAARRDKVRLLRGRIRTGFYAHCAAVVLCVAAAVILGELRDIIQIAVCAVISTMLALFAVSEHKHIKAAACAADALFAAGAILMAIFTNAKALYIVCAVLMTAALVSLIILTVLTACKEFLEDYSPLSIRREDYTLLNEVGFELRTRPHSGQTVSTAEEIPPLPPLTSEMRELAGKVRDILLADNKTTFEKTKENNDSVGSGTH